jgi:hypothetical protein
MGLSAMSTGQKLPAFQESYCPPEPESDPDDGYRDGPGNGGIF